MRETPTEPKEENPTCVECGHESTRLYNQLLFEAHEYKCEECNTLFQPEEPQSTVLDLGGTD